MLPLEEYVGVCHVSPSLKHSVDLPTGLLPMGPLSLDSVALALQGERLLDVRLGGLGIVRGEPRGAHVLGGALLPTLSFGLLFGLAPFSALLLKLLFSYPLWFTHYLYPFVIRVLAHGGL